MNKLKLFISLTFALLLGILLGIAFMIISNQGLDGEYYRALKTMGDPGVNWIDAIFRFCVVLLVYIAKLIGISYEAINIWVFIIIHPMITLLLLIWALNLRRKIKKLQ